MQSLLGRGILHPRCRFVLHIVAAALMLHAGKNTAYPDQPQDVMQVEEDWELELLEPATEKTAPQLETVISPFGHMNSIFARTTWNYREFPDFQAGGMQLQAWSGATKAADANFGTDDLSTVSETITWTQALETNGAVLTLQIKNGASVTWGSFGGASLTIHGLANLHDLNHYDTQVSQENSGITFGANRVARLRITQVRRYGHGQSLLSTDDTPRVIYQAAQ